MPRRPGRPQPAVGLYGFADGGSAKRRWVGAGIGWVGAAPVSGERRQGCGCLAQGRVGGAAAPGSRERTRERENRGVGLLAAREGIEETAAGFGGRCVLFRRQAT
jgi:hypothetical protein